MRVLTSRRRRRVAHQCGACRKHWALQLVEGSAGSVIRCRFCGTVRVAGAPVSTAFSS